MASHDIITMKKICEKYLFYNAIIMKLVLKNDINIYDFKNSIVERFKTIDILVKCAWIKFECDFKNYLPKWFRLHFKCEFAFFILFNK